MTKKSSTLSIEDEPGTNPRARFLTETAQVTTARGNKYGPPAVHFARTVGMINSAFGHILKRPLTTSEWAQFMIIDKIARHQNVPIKDNLQDIAGYAACAFECDQIEL